MGRPKKNKNVETEIEAEAGLSTVAVQQAPAVLVSAKNEIPDEYTLEVDADYDPAADLFRIPKPDPKYKYRWLRDEAKNLSVKTTTLLYQKGGWQLCPTSHIKRIGFVDREISPDGLKRMGEHVLAFMPKELWDRKEDAKNEKTMARTNAINQLLKEGDPSVGGKEMHRTMKGIQPGHKLGMSSKED